jgi:hypothetical protein
VEHEVELARTFETKMLGQDLEDLDRLLSVKGRAG